MAAKLVVDNTRGMRFTVMWKKLNAKKSEKRTYNVTNLQELARVLYHAEQVTRETVESVYIHQHFDDGRTLEVVSIDKLPQSNVNPHIIFSDKDTSTPAPSVTKKKWNNVPRGEEDENVINVVLEALKKAKGSLLPAQLAQSQAKPNVKLLNKEGMIMAGIFYQAYPAESRPKEIKK